MQKKDQEFQVEQGAALTGEEPEQVWKVKDMQTAEWLAEQIDGPATNAEGVKKLAEKYHEYQNTDPEQLRKLRETGVIVDDVTYMKPDHT